MACSSDSVLIDGKLAAVSDGSDIDVDEIAEIVCDDRLLDDEETDTIPDSVPDEVKELDNVEQKEEERGGATHDDGQFAVELPPDNDYIVLTWHGCRVIVPYITELVKDVGEYCKQRSILVSNVTLDDIYTDKFRQYLDACLKFTIHFDNKTLSRTTHGCIMLVCSTPQDAATMMADMATLRDGLTVSYLTYKQSGDDIISDFPVQEHIKQDAFIRRLLFVGNVEPEGTEDSLREQFPGLRRIIASRSDTQHTGYVYLEYNTEAEVLSALKASKEGDLDGRKLFVVAAYTLNKDRLGLLSDDGRRQLLVEIRALSKKKRLVDNITDEYVKLQKKIYTIKSKLQQDRLQRERWCIPLPKIFDTAIKTTLDDQPTNSKPNTNYHSVARGRSSRGRGLRTYAGGGRGPYTGSHMYQTEDMADKLVSQLQGLVASLRQQQQAPQTNFVGRFNMGQRGTYTRQNYFSRSNFGPPPRQTGFSSDYNNTSSYRGGYCQQGLRMPLGMKRPAGEEAFDVGSKRHATGTRSWGQRRGGQTFNQM